MLILPAIAQVGTSRDDLLAYRVTGAISSAEMDQFAEHLNLVFDNHDRVDLLIIFDRYREAEGADLFDWEAIRSWFRAGSKVGRYVVVGDADHAGELLGGLSSILPVTPEIFDEEIAAWRALDARAAS
ncbi:STAS/SEC14 domain-containing protein [Sulfitobacter aestuarii]|uniref:STAS/SEC14 domain-containing protein n=1 Tax=Sulfitobacter aestuarii TaxID=2161676 RepID=A0ABW5U6F2_9RHOB